ncbi:hypothetical protein ABEB36_006695 [Hypothenemus hampei]|uniref:Peptidase S1 domain-containing protein n=1 Tax=Hypothenemus hampei TaxID=57062 RepID=A0ABD1ERF2_HYPHA
MISNRFFVILPVLVFLVVIQGHNLPSSPCPDVFQYGFQPNGDVYGSIMIPYDGSSTLQLGINASLKGYFTDNKRVKLTIKMNTPERDIMLKKINELNYNLYFPFQNPLPKITKIQYNSNILCTGPPEELLPGAPGVTSLWSGHKYYFQSPNSIATTNLKPSIPNDTPNKAYLPVDTNQRNQKPISNQNPIQCGTSNNIFVPLILGGRDIDDGTYPWLTAMFTATGNGYRYKCTANLISRNHVITAARCVNFYKVQVVPLEDILLVFGKSNIKNWATSTNINIRGASNVKTHPDFDPNSGHCDISVIRLDRPIDFSATISPICLWEFNDNLNEIMEKTGIVAGWGADEAAQKLGKFSISMAKAIDMPVVPEESCLNSNLTYFQLTSDTTFCAGRRDGTGTCIGDSGAGFMMVQNGRFYLRGLTSLILNDAGKCSLGNYMVFVDAGKLLNWIKQAINE